MKIPIKRMKLIIKNDGEDDNEDVSMKMMNMANTTI